MSLRIVKTPKEHLKPTRDNIEKITEILKILSPLPISFFAFIRAYKNEAAIGVYSEAIGLQKMLEAGIYSPFFDKEGSILADGLYFSNDLPELLKTRKSPEAVNHYLEKIREIQKEVVASWDNAFFIVRKNKLYDEVFYFSANIEPGLHRAFFLNHGETLKEFCFYFLSEASEIIKEAKHYAIKYPLIEMPNNSEHTDKLFTNFPPEKMKAKLSVKSFRFIYKNQEVTLTQREFSCLKLVISAEKPKEAAPKLGVSIKGYESIIQRVKDKFGISDKKELLLIYSDSIYAK